MVQIQSGPVGLTFLILMIFSLGFGLCWLGFWMRARLHRRSVHQAQALTALIDEVRRLVAQDQKSINDFVHDFSRELGIEFAGADWLKQVSLADARNHVECAIFDLIQGCACGQCVGVSNGGPFWVEARFHGDGVALSGFVVHEVRHQHVNCAPNRQQQTHVDQHENVEMTCDCGRPVTTSLTHLAEGKRPKCIVCISAESARG